MNILLDQLASLINKYHFKLYGYVFMPDHVHLIIQPPENIKLSKIIGEFKSLTARKILNMWKNNGLKVFDKLRIIKDGKERFAFWQRRYYDHNCRTKETVIEKINYCHNNPVKKGLVAGPSEWKWSSYRWHNGLRGAGIKIDTLE